MKKLLIALCAVLALTACAAFAEEAAEPATEKFVLWEHVAKEIDENGTEIDVPVKVTLETKGPVEIFENEAEVIDGFIGRISREGYAPVTVTITAADYGPHANLNDATDEQLQLFIDSVAQQYEEGTYTSDILKTEGGNTYLAVGDSTVRSIWTIYEDTIMELIQYNDDFSPLTEEDQNFAIEIFQGIWTE